MYRHEKLAPQSSTPSFSPICCGCFIFFIFSLRFFLSPLEGGRAGRVVEVVQGDYIQVDILSMGNQGVGCHGLWSVPSAVMEREFLLWYGHQYS